MTEHDEEATLSLEELDADQPNALLADALTSAKAEVPERTEREWEKLDGALFARIEKERATERRRERSRVVWLSFAGVVAAAAAAIFYVHGTSTPPTAPVALAEAPAGTLVTTGGATVTASGKPIADGYALAKGDSIAVNGGNAVFAQDGKVRFSIESGSTVAVTHPTAPLILALAIGATEADVTPVPTGDAFAVDVTAQNGAVARVAVHGTHLRVARTGDHVVVDVTEGVVAVGPVGAEGTLVHAPAHVEFDATDAAHTVVVNRAEGAVRAADTAVHQASVAPLATQAAVHPTAHPVVGQPSTTKPVDTVTPPVDPEQTLAQDVKSCIVAVPNSTQVSLTVETKLTLRLTDDGTVQSARFEPPLPADAQECAARAIYRKGLFAKGGDVTIPIVVRR